MQQTESDCLQSADEVDIFGNLWINILDVYRCHEFPGLKRELPTLRFYAKFGHLKVICWGILSPENPPAGCWYNKQVWTESFESRGGTSTPTSWDKKWFRAYWKSDYPWTVFGWFERRNQWWGRVFNSIPYPPETTDWIHSSEMSVIQKGVGAPLHWEEGFGEDLP